MMNIIEKRLGDVGNILSSCRTRYRKTHPNNLIIYNSNIFVDNVRLWNGDIDITISNDDLIEISKLLNKSIYVVFGEDKRLNNDITDTEKYCAVVYSPDGTHRLNNRLTKFYEF